MKRLKYRIYSSKHGNVFMTEIAFLIRSALVDLGYETELFDDGLPVLSSNSINLVVAPHEYFLFHRSYSREDRLDAARHCIPITTEQPGTSWFEESFKYCRESPCVFDLNTSAVGALSDRGLEAHHFPLGYHPSWDVWCGRPQVRPTDLIYLASSTAKRDAFLARHANVLASLRCELYISRSDAPAVGGRADFLTGRRRSTHLSLAKVLLNIHRGDHASFEWHRMLAALANGCVVLSEPAQDYAPLVPLEPQATRCSSSIAKGGYAGSC